MRRGGSGDRRFVATILFTDVVGSTEMAARLGDSAWKQLLRSYYQVARREVRRYAGREVDTAGDGFLAAFDAPAQAVRCASAMVDALWAEGIPIRAGLHTGECERIGGKVGGIAVHIGARVAGLAGAGEIFVTGTTQEMTAGSGIAFDPLGSKELRGVPGDWRVFSVVTRDGRGPLQEIEIPEPREPEERSRRRWILTGGVAAAAVIALVALWFATRGGTPTTRPPQGLGAAKPFVGVVGIDANTGAVDTRVPISFGQNAVPRSRAITAGSGFVWAADWDNGVLYKVNPSSGAVVNQLAVPAPLDAAAIGDQLWVSSGGPGDHRFDDVVRIDIPTNEEVGGLDAPTCCGGMAADRGMLWVLADSGLSLIDPRTESIETLDVGGHAMAVGAGRVWVLDQVAGTVTPVDEHTSEVGQPIGLGGNPSLLAFGHDALWIVDSAANAVQKVPVSGSTGLETVPVGENPTDVAVGAGSVWVANSGDGTVTRIEPLGARVLDTIDVQGTPVRLTVYQGVVWVTNTPAS
jgi:class 3 adenylate cyclase